jgi:hypothetical protein
MNVPPRKRNATDIYVATQSFAAEVDGDPVFVNKDERVRAGHPLLDTNPDFFEPVDDVVHYDVEQATAAPGEKRGDPS